MGYQRASEDPVSGDVGAYERASHQVSNVDAARLARYRQMMAASESREPADPPEPAVSPQRATASRPMQPTSAYQSVSISVAQQRQLRQQQAEAQHRQWERQEQERIARQAEIERQRRRQEQKAREFLKCIKSQDPLEPDRRWFEDYAKHCTSELEAAMDMVGVMG